MSSRKKTSKLKEKETEWQERIVQVRRVTKVKNVSWSKEKEKWKSYIKINGKQIHLGYTIDYFESCCLSFSAINKYHKEFANRN